MYLHASHLERASPYKLSVCVLISFFVCRNADEDEEEVADDIISQEGLQCLASLIVGEIKHIEKTGEKGLDELLQSTNEAFRTCSTPGEQEKIAQRLEKTIRDITSPDALVDLFSVLKELTVMPSLEALGSGGGRGHDSRPLYIQSGSYFGVFLRLVLLDCSTMSFSQVAKLFDAMVIYSQPLPTFTNLLGRRGSTASTYRRPSVASSVSQHRSSVASTPRRGSVVMPQRRASYIAQGLPGLSEDVSFAAEGLPGLSEDPDSDVSMDMSMSMDGSVGMSPAKDTSMSVGDRSISQATRVEQSIVGPARGAGGQQVDASVLSVRQVQSYLQEMVLSVEAGHSSQVEHDDIDAEVSSFLAIHPELPRAHFLRYLNDLHHREQQGSLDALHRYFDYAMRRGGPNPVPGDAKASRNIVQYAALNLAVLHLCLGHSVMAMDAFNETVRVAQQNSDQHCIAYTLSWLHELMENNRDPQEPEVLRKCVLGAGALEMGRLSALSTLALANEVTGKTAGAGGKAGLGRFWGLLQAAHAGGAEVVMGWGNEQAGRRRARPKPSQAADIARQRLLVLGAAMGRFGYPAAAHSAAVTLLSVYAETATASETEAAMALLINSMLHGQGQGQGQYLHDSCVFKQVLELLCKFKGIYPYATSSIWAHSTLLALHEWCLLRGEIFIAEGIGRELRAVSTAKLGLEQHIEAQMQYALLLQAKGHWEAAEVHLRQLSQWCDELGRAEQHCRLLLLHAQVWLAGSTDSAGALRSVLLCMAECEAYSLTTLHAQATLLLAQLQLDLGQGVRATALVRGAMSQLMEHGPLLSRGEAWLLLAKCKIFSRDQSAAINCLEEAMPWFKRVHALKALQECFYLLARLLAARDGADSSRCEEAAASFDRVSVALNKNAVKELNEGVLAMLMDEGVLATRIRRWAKEEPWL
ncbi:unnamed protein product [Chrysoparadoxa australica]